MRPLTVFRSDDRAVSSSVNHALALAITALLITLLVTAVGNYVNGETDRVTRAELEALGARLADDVEAADRLTRDGGEATVSTQVPAQVVDNEYTVALEHGPPCHTETTHSDTCLELTVPPRDISVIQPLRNGSTLRIDRETDTLRINASRAGGRPTAGRAFELGVEATVGVGRVAGAGGANPVVGNLDPIAGFIFSPGNPIAGDNITFRNDTEDLDGSIRQHTWRFEQPSGGTRTVTGPTATYSYDVPGRYEVTLEVSDDDGDTDTVSRRIPVSGLLYNGDATARDFDGNGDAGGVRLSLNNSWPHDVTILAVGVDPRLDGGQITRLDTDHPNWCSGDPELRLEAEPTDFGTIDAEDGYVKYCGSDLLVSPDGTVATLTGLREDSDGERAVVSSGTNVTLDLREFTDSGTEIADAETYEYDVAIRYLVDGKVYVSKFTIFEPDTTAAVTWGSTQDWDDAPGESNVTHPADTVRLSAAGGSGLPDAGLEVWLPLNETTPSGVAKDYAGTPNHFSVEGDPVTGVGGASGDAYRFTGDDWLLDDDGPQDPRYLRGEDAFTISMWVQADQVGRDYGLVDTVDDGADGDDDELGLRYDSSGYAGGGSDSFKASIQTGQPFPDSYAYEYESNVQSTAWKHVVMRWSEGDNVEVFLDGSKLNYTYREARANEELAGLEFLAIARSQKDDTDALWEGRIDEVRVYDRKLGDQEVEALATGGSLKEGSITTEWKSTSTSLDLEDLQLRYDVARHGGTVKVTPYANVSGTVEAGKTITLNGDNGVREVRGLTGNADSFRLKIEFAGTSNTPAASSFTLSE